MHRFWVLLWLKKQMVEFVFQRNYSKSLRPELDKSQLSENHISGSP